VQCSKKGEKKIEENRHEGTTLFGEKLPNAKRRNQQRRIMRQKGQPRTKGVMEKKAGLPLLKYRAVSQRAKGERITHTRYFQRRMGDEKLSASRQGWRGDRLRKKTS